MGERLTWRIERDPYLEASSAPDPARPPEARRAYGPRWRGYTLLLLLAAATGFGIGRWAETDGRIWAAVQGTLALAQLAIERQDRDLLSRTLHPLSDPRWREEEITRQLGLSRAPGPDDLLDIGPTRSDLMQVRIRVTDGNGAVQDELRLYRRQGDRWLQSAPIQLGDRSSGPQP
ncbi:MAG TPA: hypothetical protein PLZ56_00425 [Anaerolineae bacterium]|nr:hypothetical protein [Anaerolineae bacterium]